MMYICAEKFLKIFVNINYTKFFSIFFILIPVIFIVINVILDCIERKNKK